MESTAVILTCLLAAGPSLGAFSQSPPIPFHASPIFHKTQETRNREPISLLPFLPSEQQQQQSKPTYHSGFVPLRYFGVPPPEAAPLPWGQLRPLPRAKNSHEPLRTPFAPQTESLAPSNLKTVKGATVYPKKWIPAPPDGKKIKPKNVEKRRKQILVASSMTTKDMGGRDAEEGKTHAGAIERFQKPKIERLPERYEPLAIEETHPQPIPAHSETPVEEVAFPGSRTKPKPYAHNHQQEASGTGFTPLFAAEASGTQHGASSGFVGHEGLHQVGDGSGDRITFHVHGEKGPNSYRFGYDTGKGPDRHFRYEERDDHGNVKGHFGFYDKQGKLQVVHYSADPKNGFSADGGNFGKHGVL